MDTKHFAASNTSDGVELAPRSSRLAPRSAFTLVELLVVITIISILAALITVAAVGALKSMNRTRIKTEINEIANGFDEYKNKTTAYPPNCQTDGTGGSNPLKEADILLDLRRHLKQMAGRSQESDDLARCLTGQNPTDTNSYPPAAVLRGGLTAAEAVVFWLGGFSSDPKFPISGDPDGPSYSIPSIGDSANAARDPIESRKWVYPFNIERLGPRDSDGHFNGRFIEYKAPNGAFRRINFWQYFPTKSQQPYVYFDTSRHPAGSFNGSSTGTIFGYFDPPAATLDTSNPALNSVYAFKKLAETQGSTPGSVPIVQYINPDKFQVFHCGIDDAWDDANFARMGIPRNGIANTQASVNSLLLFPGGPFIGEVADTEVNFAQETTIEDAQK